MDSSHEQRRIVGCYSYEQHVVVTGRSQVEELRRIGNFGTDLNTVKRKDDARRGPLDRQLIRVAEANSANHKPIAFLTLHEAVYLIHALKRLDVETNEGESMNLTECWRSFKSFYKSFNANLDFTIEYAVYFHFRTRGWIVKLGDNYGVNFLLYKNGPSIDHAQYTVLIMPGKLAARPYDWKSLSTFQRVNQSIKKELLLIYTPDCAQATSDNDNPDCVRDQKLLIKKLVRHANLTT